jgi:hypothetical protein
MSHAKWTNVNGTWALLLWAGTGKEGDTVLAHRNDGTTQEVVLGAQIRPGVFYKAGRQSQVRKGTYRARTGGYNVARDYAHEYYVHEGNGPMSPLEAWHASMRGC